MGVAGVILYIIIPVIVFIISLLIMAYAYARQAYEDRHIDKKQALKKRAFDAIKSNRR